MGAFGICPRVAETVAACAVALILLGSGELRGAASPGQSQGKAETWPSFWRPALFSPDSPLPPVPARPTSDPGLVAWPVATGERLLPLAHGDSVRRMIAVRPRVAPRKKREAKISWACLGAAVLCGGASMYCKSEADGHYERYLRAGSPEKMNHYYDQARRFDRYAAVAYGGFQVSFVLWVVFFLRSR